MLVAERLVRQDITIVNVSRRECCKELGESDGELIVVGKKLALLTKSSLENVDLQRSFAYFHVLILLSYCELLRQKGIFDEAIDELIQTIAEIRERDRKALLDKHSMDTSADHWTCPQRVDTSSGNRVVLHKYAEKVRLSKLN
jgi:hypothetical protein